MVFINSNNISNNFDENPQSDSDSEPQPNQPIINYHNDTEFDSEEYENKIDNMNHLYPNLKFSSDADDYDRLDNELVNSKNAIVYYSYKCICCCPNNENSEYFEIRRNKNITYRDFYDECVLKWKYNINDFCNHSFLEHIDVDENHIITPSFGS